VYFLSLEEGLRRCVQCMVQILMGIWQYMMGMFQILVVCATYW
jgi:hypothetical protein